MAIIGVTGGIGSGKSTFCDLLQEALPIERFDADRVAHEKLAHDEKVREAVKREISVHAYREDGVPDRELIRKIVFSDRDAKSRLERILHPLVGEAWRSRVTDIRESGGHFLVDIPLLFETGAEKYFDHVVVVACSTATQLDRILARGIGIEEAQAILCAQMPTMEKVTRADRVVWNDGSRRCLGDQVAEMVKLLSHLEC